MKSDKIYTLDEIRNILQNNKNYFEEKYLMESNHWNSAYLKLTSISKCLDKKVFFYWGDRRRIEPSYIGPQPIVLPLNYDHRYIPKLVDIYLCS